MRIGIFGGTFNPPHRGHLQSSLTAAEQLGLDKLLIVPACVPPHKSVEEVTAPPEQRLAMTRLLFAQQDFAEVSDIEICRGGVSFTIDTITQLEKEYPGAQLYLLLGTDSFMNIETWERYKEILGKVTLAVFARGKGDAKEIRSHAEKMQYEHGGRIRIIENSAIEISSTDLRRLLTGREGNSLLGDSLYSYIIANRLYGARPNFPWLREKAYSMLKAKRIPHVQGCEEEAARLAACWGADEGEAREAAILHDITKKNPLEEQLILCEKYGIIADNVEMDSKKLFHAKTGAAIAKADFGVSEDVFNAILWHTTGRSGMTLLDQIIYIADYIEPTRDFDGVEILRKLAYEDLSAAVLLGLEMSIEELAEKGIQPHNTTREAIDFFQTRKDPIDETIW